MGLDSLHLLGRRHVWLMVTPPEAVLYRFLAPYGPYVSDTRRFERTRALRATGGLASPELTYDVFQRCMGYAMSVDWVRGCDVPDRNLFPVLPVVHVSPDAGRSRQPCFSEDGGSNDNR